MHFTLPTAILLAVSAFEAAALPKAANTMEKRYTTGWCGVHIVQYQKNEGPGDQSQYRLDVTLKDAIGTNMGGVQTVATTPSTPVNVDSQLPDVFIATVGFVDSDPIQFHYGGQYWESTAAQCNLKDQYDDGSRNGDCGFTC